MKLEDLVDLKPQEDDEQKAPSPDDNSDDVKED